MTSKYFYLLLSFWAFSNAVIAQKASLTVSYADCKINEKRRFEYVKILKNGQLFKELYGTSYYSDSVESLDFGTYTVVYTTTFNQEMQKNVDITEDKPYQITICPNFLDYSKETSQPLIDRLEVGDWFNILVSEKGCFHFYDIDILVKRDKKGYSITWNDIESKKHKKRTKRLNPKDIISIRQFEWELNYMNNINCTTVSTYTLFLNGKQVKELMDGSCMWDGYGYLKMALFGGE